MARPSNFRHGCHRPLLLVLGVLTTTTRSLLPSINAVIHEKRLGDASELAPYIALLPTPEELSGYAPAATWADDELSLLECSKVITDAKRLRSRQSGDEHAALEPGALADKWSALSLPGEPPSASELAWAVTVVTSRAYSAEEDGVRLSLMLPMVDMANHMGPAEVTHTVKGLEEDGKSFVVLAKEEIKRHEQVFLSYGGLPNFMLLNQFGFVLPKLVTDVALVNCEDLVAATDAAVLAPIADEGLMMREGGGAIISAWQPAGPALQAGLARLAETDALPATLVADIEAGDSGAEAAATAAYRTLLQRTLDGYSTTIAEDRAALDGGRASLPPRTLLALEFRLTQKTLLNTALATARGNLVGKSRGFA